jgi:hypothetical protein
MLGLMLLLSGCGFFGGDDESTNGADEELVDGDQSTNGDADLGNTTLIEKADFAIRLPQLWREVIPSQFTDKPSIEAIFRRSRPVSGMFPNIVLATENVNRPTTALEFSRKTIQNEYVALIDFNLINEQAVEIAGRNGILVQFEALSQIDSRRLVYYQLFLVGSNAGYIFTAALPREDATEALAEIESIFNTIVLN